MAATQVVKAMLKLREKNEKERERDLLTSSKEQIPAAGTGGRTCTKVEEIREYLRGTRKVCYAGLWGSFHDIMEAMFQEKRRKT